ncbi:MAG: RNA-guided pseudouridylation complex pseudouridine synthase subunit Cbf5 [Candidatus Heimdallarchaeota archaeon]|nr:RNA-guided pseudouridylation complex pseudouridine synthase subunit Cbf5 [Candidatus Heimdallarchaeota archaeon]
MNPSLIIVDNEAFNETRFSSYGTNPEDRELSKYIEYGFINLDKPAGPTSHEVVSIVKNILSINKAGHSGTLDPQVTGVLPIGINKSTRVLSTLLQSPKTYICTMNCSRALNQTEISTMISNFTGEIYQVPPKESNVVKKLRKRTIYSIDLLDKKSEDLLLKISCQAGTYIRTLCIDMGKSIGVVSFMKELRRIRTGPFDESSLVSLHNIFDAWNDYLENKDERAIRKVIIPVENAVKHLPVVFIRENAVGYVCHGVDLKPPAVIAYSEFNRGEMVAIKSPKKELVAIGIAKDHSSAIKENKTEAIIHPSKILLTTEDYFIHKMT